MLAFPLLLLRRAATRRVLTDPAAAFQRNLSRSSSRYYDTSLRRRIREHFTRLHAPSYGVISGAADLAANPNAPLIAFSGSIRTSLESGSATRICLTNYETCQTRIISSTISGNDRCARWSGCGRFLAFLSDRAKKGVFQPYLLDSSHLGEARPLGPVPGSVESLCWSPDGTRILFLAADLGADHGGAAGGARDDNLQPSDAEHTWEPTVESSRQFKGWRRVWVCDISTGRLAPPEHTDLNVWETCWLGVDRILAVTSDQPTESAWYSARLTILDLNSKARNHVLDPQHQIGGPAAAADGSCFAVIESLSSDRGGVAGDVTIFDATGMNSQTPDLKGVDVTQIFWSDGYLYYIGLRGTSTVAGRFDVQSGRATEFWTSDLTCGPLYPEATLTAEGTIALVSEGWNRPQELILVRPSQERTLASFAHDGTRWLQTVMGTTEDVSWHSFDGLEIQGFLCRPESTQPPNPLILNVHGGPVYTFRNKWQLNSPIIPLLVSHGYSVLSANPRGSTGRGQAFCKKVLGDIGGADAQDLLSAVDSIVQRGETSANQVGILGVSYGGYMATWLPTQSDTFAASVAIAPVTNWTSNHNLSNIGAFDRFFFQQSPYQPGGIYHQRSPVNFAGLSRTPTLQTVGARDRCVPPSQAVEYHNALEEAGVECELVTYPLEGHDIRGDSAYMDFCERTIGWFDRHLRAESR